MATRTDIHRPSAITPEDYEFVSCIYIGCKDLGPGEVLANNENKKIVHHHMKMTGGKYSRHNHGGTCHVCGAFALYLAVYYHRETNTYIQTGEDCARKLDMGDVDAFNPLRQAVKDARLAKAGKIKAEVVLKDAGLEKAWELYNANDDELVQAGAADRRKRKDDYYFCDCRYNRDCIRCKGNGSYLGQPREIEFVEATSDYLTIRDIILKLIKYGNISEGQEKYLHVLVGKIGRRHEIEAERAREREKAANCPEGRMEVNAEVLKTEYRENSYGETLKMLVKADEGFLLWGTVPSSLHLVGEEQRCLERGDRISFTATLQPSDRDQKFGFFKRPVKAKLL